MNLDNKSMSKSQTGVLRVNCIDCLDRTNVCESVFARLVLTKQLRTLGIFTDQSVEKVAPLEKLFKYGKIVVQCPNE
jgi:hypothetical protein